MIHAITRSVDIGRTAASVRAVLLKNPLVNLELGGQAQSDGGCTKKGDGRTRWAHLLISCYLVPGP